MRTLGLLGLVVGLLLVTAVMTPWVAWGVSALAGRPFTFSRVYNRVFEVLLVVGLVVTWRRLDLGGVTDLGLRRPGWARELGVGLGAGAMGLGVGLAACIVAGALVPELRFPPLKTLRKALLGAGAAVAIGVGEEAFFRGALLRRLGRDAGVVLGTVGTTLIYAAVHTIGKGGTSGPVDVWSGMERTAALFAPLAQGTAVAELVGLALLGLLLAVVRLRTGSLWVPIGIHAAWVAVFRIGRLFFRLTPSPSWLVGAGWPPLVGGAAGWLAVAVTAVVILRWSKPRS